MIKVWQRTKKDCLRACAASLLEVEYTELVDFAAFDNWLQTLNLYCSLQNKKATIKEPHQATTYCIGVGQSPRNKEWLHAVIVDKELNVIHDPYINGAAIGRIEYVITIE